MARVALGADATRAEVGHVGYGLPSFEAGRPWTVVTGIPLSFGLTLVPPPITVVALVLCERRARQAPTSATFLGGHIAAVVVIAALLWLLRYGDGAWWGQVAGTVHVGSSTGIAGLTRRVTRTSGRSATVSDRAGTASRPPHR